MTHSSMKAAVRATLEGLADSSLPQDAALGELALRYGEEIDTASWLAKAAERVLRRVQDDPATDLDLLEAVQALRNKLSARATLQDLGPKLLAALDALGATPKVRAATKGGTPGGTSASRLNAFRNSARPA